jgi:hypothetical protein
MHHQTIDTDALFENDFAERLRAELQLSYGDFASMARRNVPPDALTYDRDRKRYALFLARLAGS